jgi:AcrR family transcriptional regulator
MSVTFSVHNQRSIDTEDLSQYYGGVHLRYSFMPRPSEAKDRERIFTPRIAAAFAELGYRGTTTAALANRCGVRENVLYRTWSSKRAMFLAAVEHFYTVTIDAWRKIAAELPNSGPTLAQMILDRQAADHGRLRLYRIIFAGLTEDDPEIRAALTDVYKRLHGFILSHVRLHRGNRTSSKNEQVDDTMAAWALIGLGAVTDIQRELGLLPAIQRQQFMKEVGRRILDRH